MNHSDIEDRLKFLNEVDKLKGVVRASPLIDGSRKENRAEHSWHLAMYALILSDCSPGIDIGKVICMLLIHDIVEIDAGDTPVHGHSGHDDQEVRERNAANRLFGMLPDSQRSYMSDVWSEFEKGESMEAQFAKSLDRLQPLMQNVCSGGGTWNDSQVTHEQVLDRYGPTIGAGSSQLWEVAQKHVSRHFEVQGDKAGEQVPAVAVDLNTAGDDV